MIDMKSVLEKSRQQLIIPFGNARRRLLIIHNFLTSLLLAFFVISEKINTGSFAPSSILLVVYSISFVLNISSGIYNLWVFSNIKKIAGSAGLSSNEKFISDNQSKIDTFFGYASFLPVLFSSLLNLLGVGNPSNDAILTDFALAQSVMIGVVIILGRKAVVGWLIIVVAALFWNVFQRGWDYEYHYSTPSEIKAYKEKLAAKDPVALARQAELNQSGLNPPKITRYFTTWLVFLIVAFFASYYFSGITLDIFKKLPAVVHNIEQALEGNKALELERKVNEEKTHTFINLAHETKTPLTLLNHYLDQHIQKYGLTDELTQIKQSTEKLTRDIVNFFDLEKIQRGMNVYNHDQVVHVSKLLSDTVSLFLPYAEKKKIQVTADIASALYTKADPDALSRMFNNLIENSIKYTSAGGVVFISLKVNNGVLEFEVEDNGMGIPVVMQQLIFEPYVQINSEKKNNQGMGLGLSIVKKIADQLNAEILITSNPPEKAGTKISIQFQIADSSNAISDHLIGEKIYMDLNVLEIQEKKFDQEKATLLIVEDNVALLNLLVNGLNGKYNVFYAQSGNQAIEKLKSIPTLDLIISDVMMDDGDGYTFLEFISKHKRLSLIPFIFLTAKTDITNKISGLSMGAMDYMNKPFSISELEYKIESIISKIKLNAEALIQQAYTNLRSNALFEKENGEKDVPKNSVEKMKSFQFTGREIEIAQLILRGEATKNIAEQLFISEHTVNKHIQNIFEKSSVTSRLELVNKLNM